MNIAVQERRQNPTESYKIIAKRNKVSKSTLYDRVNNIHASPGHRVPRHLSLEQERVLMNKINAYANPGTLLSSALVREYAEVICGEDVAANWVGRFVQRHKDVIHSRHFAYQEAARLKADTSETRRAFYSLVGHSRS